MVLRFALWPRSLGGRTALTLVLALAVVQALGLTIHAFDRIDLQQLAQMRAIGIRVGGLYHSIANAPAAERAALVAGANTGALRVSLDADPAQWLRPPGFDGEPPPGFRDALPRPPEFEGAPPLRALGGEPPPPPFPGLPRMHHRPPPFLERPFLAGLESVPIPAAQRWTDLMIHGDPPGQSLVIGLRLPDGPWLNLRAEVPAPRPWASPDFLAAFLVMTATAAVLIVWAVRRLTAPVRTLSAAAEALGRDVNAPPLPEDGPTEVAKAAAAFNTMAARIRRFVQDRTLLLAAIGHDLRTPITRLKLRAEFIEDDEQRRKILADLDELEAMVAATLAFGRDVASSEPVVPLDLPILLRTILDEAGDARPGIADRLTYEGPDHLTLRARPLALKRALANLIGNAVKYGGGAWVTLTPPAQGQLTVTVDDPGPGIPPDEMARIFEPFHRVEASRNRETGGTGLGLPIARNILRAHGGDVALSNRAEGGVRATVTLPA